MKSARLGEIENFPFVEKPDPRLIRDGYLTLHELGAVDEENELTPIGRQLGKLPVDPRVGRMILAADNENCLSEVLIIASALSVQDPRERPVEMAGVADEAHKQFASETSDFFTYLNIWDFFREKSKHLSNSQLRKQCKQQFLSYLRLREWHEVHQQIHAVVTEMGFKPNTSDAAPERILRALLAGLLSNVGNKTDTAEYAGLRGGKFFVFPGSILFSKKPAWVMAAEIVETQRLYARTVGKVLPEWIEELADHLLKRTYTDPQWNAQRAEVTAGERVSLKGLILVPHRTVSYGPIDPRTAREIFINHALVEGQFASPGEFMKHNQKLLHRVRSLQARTRRQDLLAEPRQRFAFFDARVPKDVYNGILFERWRKTAEKQDKERLFMQLADIAKPEMSAIPESEFPDEILAGNLNIQLSYLHDTALPNDGINAIVPLAMLNQLPAAPFDWVVPGMLHEKIVELIRTLPKAIRIQLVPAPDAASKVISTLQRGYQQAPFFEVISHQLGKLVGAIIHPNSFDVAQIPNHLRVTFCIIDAGGRPIASDRDLTALRTQLGVKARESFAAAPPPQFTRDGIKRWDFGDLPERIEIQRAGATFSGFPALIDQGKSVGLRVLDSRLASVQANRAGVRRLFMLQLEAEMRQLVRSLNHVEEMSLRYKPLGSWAELKDDLLSAAVNRALFTGNEDIRSRDVFINKAEDGWKRLSAAARELNTTAYEILVEFGKVQVALERDFPPMLLAPIEDMRDQLRRLVPKAVLSTTPAEYLVHLPRYIKAIQIRLNKLMNAGLSRDIEIAAMIRPLSTAYSNRRKSHNARGLIDPELNTLWWMIQELRVSLFAQELKAVIPISVQRVERQLAVLQP